VKKEGKAVIGYSSLVVEKMKKRGSFRSFEDLECWKAPVERGEVIWYWLLG